MILRFAFKAVFEVVKSIVKVTGQLAKGAVDMAGSTGGPGIRLKVDVRITKNRFDEIRRKGAKALEDAMEAIAEQVKEDARKRAPVVTGRLRDSIDVARAGDEWIISASAPYARFVEYGGAFTPAHAFLRPATRKAGQSIAREVKARMPKH